MKIRTCLFCSARLTRKNRSREHAIPRWLVIHLKAQDKRVIGRTWTYPNKPTIIFNEREHDALSLVLGNVCKLCNTGWMAQLEEDTRHILEELWDVQWPKLLSHEKCNILGKWTFKTAATLNYSSKYKRIIPLEHIHQFFTDGRIPQNATVDLALSHNVGIRFIIGGNRKFVTWSGLTDSKKRATYVITIQLDHLLLRLAWVPVDGVKALAVPVGSVYRIFPRDNTEFPVQVVRRSIFKDHAQFHFSATLLAEEGIYPSVVLQEYIYKVFVVFRIWNRRWRSTEKVCI